MRRVSMRFFKMTEGARVSWHALAILMLVAPCLSLAQGGPVVVRAKMLLASDAVHPGSTARAAVIAQIAPEYHINDHHPTLNYLIPTQLKFGPDPSFSIETVSYPKGKLEKFAFAEKGLSVYEGRLVIPTVLRVKSSAAAGDYTLKGQVSYQACNATACFPPATANFSLPIRIVDQNVPIKSATPQVFGKQGS
jgi:DsbC/DsbD-like thiol-disulfide interchange protein